MGGRRQVGRALRELVDESSLYRAGYGVFARTSPGVGGVPRPELGLAEIGKQALGKLGVEATLGRAAQRYADGKTTQVPYGCTLNVGRARVQRRMRFGAVEIKYERSRKAAP